VKYNFEQMQIICALARLTCLGDEYTKITNCQEQCNKYGNCEAIEVIKKAIEKISKLGE